jgi:tape measure domain-containing protein
MSEGTIKYTLEVLDGFSEVTKKLKEELSEIKKLTEFKFNSSDFKGLAQLSKEYDKIAKSAERIKKAKTGFTLIGESFSSSKINAAALRANRAYEKSLKNALVPYNSPFIMMGGGRGGGSYNPRGYKPNFNIPINSTYRRDAAGTGIVPYSRGGAVMSYGQRPMIDVTGTGRIIEQDAGASFNRRTFPNRKAYAGAYTPIKFNPYTGQYEGVFPKEPKQPKLPKEPSQPQQPSQQPSSFGGGGGVSLANVAKGMGYYRAIDMAVGLPREIIDTRRQFDSLNATLQTVLPSYDKTTSSSQLAANEIEYLIKVVRTLGLDLNATKEEYVKFLAASAGKKSLPQARKEFESFAKLSTVYGIDPYRFKLVMSAITQTTSKGILNLEELQRQLGDSLPGAVKLFADSLGLTEPVFRKLVSDGKITSDVLANVSTYIDNNAQVTSGLDIAMQKLGARLNRVSTSWTLLVESLSQGEAGTMINDWVTILDNGIQRLTKSLEIMGTVWNSSPIKGIRKLYDIAEVGAEIVGQGVAAGAYDLKNAGNEGRAQFIENLKKGNFEHFNKNLPSNQFTPIPQSYAAPQEVVVKIIGENLPSGLSIKQESKSYGMTPRPRTVIAGGL